MTKEDKRLLLTQAVKLTTLGGTVERERNKLKKLVGRGVSYSDPKMLQTLEQLEQVNAEWKRLEAEHLELRKRLGSL